MTEAQDQNRQKLAHSAEKLVELLALNAPPQIVCGQVSQIFGQALMTYGEVVYTQVGKAARESKLIAAGFCVKCEREYERTPEATYPDHCPECAKQLEAEGGAPVWN